MAITILDKSIFYCLLLYSLSSVVSITGADISMRLAVILGIIRYIWQPFKINLDSNLAKTIAFFIGMVAIASFFSYDVGLSLKRLFEIMSRSVLLLLAVAFIKDKDKLVAIFLMLCTSMLIADGYAIWQGIQGNFRAMSIINGHPMVFAGHLVEMLPLLMVFCFKDAGLSPKIQIFTMMTTVLSILALAFNGTRGAWIGVAVAFGFYGLLHMRKKPKQLIGIIILLLFICILAVHVPQIHDRLATLTDASFQSNTERILIWRSAWHMFLDRPLTGLGLGQFQNLYLTHYISPMAHEPDLAHAHNNVMQFLAETGLVGTGGFIYLFGFIMYDNYKKYITTENLWALALLLVTIGFFVQGLTEYNLTHVSVLRMYSFIIGLAYAARNINEQGRG